MGNGRWKATRARREAEWEKSGIKVFHSQDEFEKWTEQFDEASDYQNTPVYIYGRNGQGLDFKDMDMTTECKSYKTAIKRFQKYFEKAFPGVKDWCEAMMESCENGYFRDQLVDYSSPYYQSGEHRQEIQEMTSGGSFGWQVEQLDDRIWYIFLNTSGGYAR